MMRPATSPAPRIAVVMLQLVALCGLAFAQTAFADSIPSGEACQQRYRMEFARAVREFRANVYGLPGAADAPAGSVRHDAGGEPWYKTGDGTWISAFEETMTDDEMEVKGELRPQKGLIETKGVLTSDLVPVIGQSLWALQCNLEWICNNARQSTNDNTTNTENAISVPGCIETTMWSFGQCQVNTVKTDPSHENDIQANCDQEARAVLAKETDILTMVVEYDAAYRSFLQFAGNFDLFLREFRWPLLTTLRQLLELSDLYERIPCFLGSCETFPPGLRSSSSASAGASFYSVSSQ